MNKPVARTAFLRLFTTFASSAFFAATVLAQPAKANSIATLAELQSRLREHVTQPKFDAAMWGVKVVSLDSGKTLFEHHPQKLFSPASNSKLYTAALGLHRFGPEHRIRTSLYSAKSPSARGTLSGDLIIYGRGDPTINARLNNGDIFRALQPLVAALTNAGVKRIRGDLIGDTSYFRGPPFGSGWAWDDSQYYYGAEISALTINDNILQLTAQPAAREGAPCRLELKPATSYVVLSNLTRTVSRRARGNIRLYRPIGGNVTYITGQLPLGGEKVTEDVTVDDPAGLFASLFKDALSRHGIKVSGRVRSTGWLERRSKPLDLAQLTELGCVQSLPMRDILREIQKPSQNLYTDLLLAYVGEDARATNTAGTVPGANSEDLGISELERFLKENGIAPGEVQFEEGSGLSRNNLTTPNATIALLERMSRHQCADVYLAALPIAGVDGTLRNRMKDTPAAGNVRAKTGTLRWANALSGYVTTAAGERLVFCIMLNRYSSREANRTSRMEIDDIAVMLAGFAGKSGE